MLRTRETDAGSALRETAQPPPDYRSGRRAVHWRHDDNLINMDERRWAYEDHA